MHVCVVVGGYRPRNTAPLKLLHNWTKDKRLSYPHTAAYVTPQTRTRRWQSRREAHTHARARTHVHARTYTHTHATLATRCPPTLQILDRFQLTRCSAISKPAENKPPERLFRRSSEWSLRLLRRCQPARNEALALSLDLVLCCVVARPTGFKLGGSECRICPRTEKRRRNGRRNTACVWHCTVLSCPLNHCVRGVARTHTHTDVNVSGCVRCYSSGGGRVLFGVVYLVQLWVLGV